MKNAFLILFCCALLMSCNKPKEEAAEPAADVKPPQAEIIADTKYAEMTKRALDNLSSGNIDAFVSDFSDSAVYYWSAGDSLAGKAAIIAYWKDRRANVIESLTSSNDIWLTVQVNEPQKGPDLKGIWVLGWWQTSVVYKNGQSLKPFWVHTDYHFNSSGKIDAVTQYIDRAPINAALAAKK
jgi:hypothetical protein